MGDNGGMDFLRGHKMVWFGWLIAGLAGVGLVFEPPGPVFAADAVLGQASSVASRPVAAVTGPVRPDPVLAGRVVALDPGHGGGQGSGRLVSDGRGRRKVCNTSGTATAAGFSEHAFTLNVAKRTAKLLRQRGIIVRLTRTKGNLTKALCVDKRGTFGQRVGAELMVSIHGDGNDNTSVKGYYALISSPPLNKAQGEPSRQLARHLLKQLKKSGFTQNAISDKGFSRRTDLAGLNHSTIPVVMMELGEMRNPTEAKLMSSAKGRQRYAKALANGIIKYLRANPRRG